MSNENPKARLQSRTVFYSINAQWDNLGDIEIRNTALEWIRETGNDVIAFTGAMPKGYVDAFEIDSSVTWESNAFRYQRTLWKHILLRHASIVFAPGPQVFSAGRRSLMKSFVNWVNVVGVRISGGKVLAVGRSLRGKGRMARALEASIIARFNLFVVRDTRSAEVLGAHLENAPDLAFEHASVPKAGERTMAVISLRGDRPIEQEALRTAVDQLVLQGLTPVLVTQVKRDDDQHRQLAEGLGIESVLWEEHSHSEQLALVRDHYARAQIVLSNRLHALIFGMQFGAIPIGVLDEGSDKLTSTLRPWVELRVTPATFKKLDGEDWTGVDVRSGSTRLAEDLVAARVVLSDVRARFIGHLLPTKRAEIAEAVHS